MNQSEWDLSFLRDARNASLRSKDPSTKVGAVLTLGREPVSTGYNGFAKGVPDKQEWLNDRETKLKLTLHAEENAAIFAKGRPVDTCYTYPVPPCAHCLNLLIQIGVKRIVAPSLPQKWREGIWKQSYELVNEIYKSGIISYTELNLPIENDVWEKAVDMVYQLDFHKHSFTNLTIFGCNIRQLLKLRYYYETHSGKLATEI